MKIAFVYDRVNKFGGAERILLALHDIWPSAPLYTSVYDKNRSKWAKVFPEVMPSFLQKIPFALSRHELIPYLMPFAFESFQFDEYDLIISVTSEASKSIITKPHTYHICYCLTPTRYLWSSYFHYKDMINFGILTPIAKLIYPYISRKLRYWEAISASRPDLFIAISEVVASRIKKYYNREAKIILPPVDTEKFIPKTSVATENYYLIVSRLVSYKRIDLAIEAFNKLGWPLIIIGRGSKLKELKKKAYPNITFISKHLTDDELMSYYQNCKAIIFPGDEDLGLVPVEAQAAGIPVIAYKCGGALETIMEGVTGEFFDKPESESLINALLLFTKKQYNKDIIRKHSQTFDINRFKKVFKNYVEEQYIKYQKS